MRKTLKSNLYIKGKFGKHIRETLNTDTEFLYENGKRKSNIKVEDLPEYYIPVSCKPLWYMNGWLNVKDIKFIYYVPAFNNHFRKDDALYISYNGPIGEVYEQYTPNTIKWHTVVGYDFIIDGINIDEIIEAIKKYAPFVYTKTAEDNLKKKDKWLKENHPECLPLDYKFDNDSFE